MPRLSHPSHPINLPRLQIPTLSRIPLLLLLPLTLLTLTLPQSTASSPTAASTPTPPTAAITTFATDPGITIELVAAEPLVTSPAALAWDAQGRLFVAENPGYPTGPRPGQPPAGTLVHLADTNADGRPDQRIVFADGFNFPNGLMPWRDGWLLTDAPNLWWLADTNHDGRADTRQLWFTGFATNQSTQLRACYPTLGPDGWIYLARGLSAGHITSPLWPHLPPVDLKDGDFRFRPDGTAAEAIGGNTQFGLVLDDANRRFLVSNRNPLMHAVVPPRFWRRHPALPFSDLVHDVAPSGYAARVSPRSPDTTTAGFMPEFLAAPHAGSFTAACGIHQYFGSALGPNDPGAWFICEPAQNLVQRQLAQPDGPTFSSHRAPADRDFLTSTDGWFRPVFLATGPDGALYLADLYRRIIDHPDYLPAHIRHQLDYDAGKNLGRIWRLHHTNAAPSLTPTRPGPFPSTPAQQIAALGDPNLWTRQTAHRLLLESPRPADLLPPLLAALTNDLPDPRSLQNGWTNLPRHATDPATGPHLATARRLWLLSALLDAVLQQRQRADEPLVLAAHVLLQARFHPSPSVRESAWRISLARTPNPKHALPDVPYDLVAWWADDPSPAVRFHVALACGDQDDWSPVLPALAHILRLDATNRWSRAAVLSGLHNREQRFLDELFRQPLPDSPGIATFLQDFARLADASPGPTSLRLLDLALDPSHAPTNAAWPLAILQGLSANLRNAGSPPLGTFLADNPVLRREHPDVLPRFEAAGRRAIHTSLDPLSPTPRRIAALELLADLDPTRLPETWPALTNALAESQPHPIRLAAIRTLGRSNHPDAPALLAARPRWTSDPPALRDAALASLTSRPQLLPALLDALERGDAPLWIVDPQRRRQLQNHAQPALRVRAQRLFANAGGGDRHKVLEELRPILQLPASGARGQPVFERSCASCHTLDGVGNTLGPDLSGVRNQPAEALLLHIIVPDAEIYPGYQACDVETRDGRSLTGILASETPDSVTLRRAGGEQDILPRTAIASLTLSRLSLMPQELEKTMSRQDLADLLARLRGQP